MFVYLKAISKRWVAILVFVLCATAVFTMLEIFVFPSQYQSGVQMHVRVSDAQQYSDLQASTIIMNDYMAFATSESILKEVINNLVVDFPQITEPGVFDVEKHIKIEAVTQTRLFWVYVTSETPQLSAALANEIGRVMVSKDKELTGHENLNIMSNASVPRNPTFPKYFRDIPICAAAAALLSIAVVLFLDYVAREKKNIAAAAMNAEMEVITPYVQPALHQPYVPPALFANQPEHSVAMLRDLAVPPDDATQLLGPAADNEYTSSKVEKTHTASFVAVQSVTVSTQTGSSGQPMHAPYANYSTNRSSAGTLTPTHSAPPPQQPVYAPQYPVRKDGNVNIPITPMQQNPEQTQDFAHANRPAMPNSGRAPEGMNTAPKRPQHSAPASPTLAPVVSPASAQPHAAAPPAQQRVVAQPILTQTHGHAAVPHK